MLPFLGAVLEPPASCWLLTELMPGGTLKAWRARMRVGRAWRDSWGPVPQPNQRTAPAAWALPSPHARARARA